MLKWTGVYYKVESLEWEEELGEESGISVILQSKAGKLVGLRGEGAKGGMSMGNIPGQTTGILRMWGRKIARYIERMCFRKAPSP